MDGVIVNTEPIHHQAFLKHFKQLNIHVSDEEYATFTGNSTKNIFQKLKDKYNLKDDVELLAKNKLDLFHTAFDEKQNLELMPGVKNLIQELYDNRIQLLLASSSAKTTIEKVLNRFELKKYFKYYVSGEDFEFSKPHPAIFNEAVILSGFRKSECIVIEDSTNGIKAAKAAGLFCIGYKSKFSILQDMTLADRVITDFNQLDFDIIKHLNS